MCNKKCLVSIVLCLFCICITIGISSCDGCGGGNDVHVSSTQSSTLNDKKEAKQSISKANYNLYIDNSGSMLGYTNATKQTNYQRFISYLVEHIYSPANSYHFHSFAGSISEPINPKNSDSLSKFLENFASGKLPRSVNKSLLKDVLVDMLNRQDTNDISIIVSDFDSYPRTPAYLATYGAEIKGKLKEKLSKNSNMSTVFLRLTSESGKNGNKWIGRPN